MKPTIGAFIAAALIIASADAFSHEMAIRSGASLKWNPAREGRLPSDSPPAAFDPRRNIFAPEFIVVLANRWAVGQVLHICFYKGSPELRARILVSASQWLKYANLKFDTGGPKGRDCSSKDSSEIRIGFSEPGDWSYIGTESLAPELVSQNLSSMNLEGFDTAPPAEPNFSGTVLHEFGHALGFHHEHQSPAEGCDGEYDWPKLYAYYLKEYGWSQSKTNLNVKQLSADRRAFDWSPPDPKSIMAYASDPQFLKKGKASPCYFKENDVLSALDEQGAQKTYYFQDAKKHLLSQRDELQFLISRVSSDESKLLSTQLRLTVDQLKTMK